MSKMGGSGNQICSTNSMGQRRREKRYGRKETGERRLENDGRKETGDRSSYKKNLALII